MTKLSARLITAGAPLFLSCLDAVPAGAASPVTFVSGKGADVGACKNPQHPCRTFQFAINQTSAGGEVKALDPADYGPMTIKQSISITGVDGASINISSGNAITVNASVNDVINLTRLTLDGTGKAASGVELDSGGSLTITDCQIRNFAFDGIVLLPTSRTLFLIADTVVSDNFLHGIFVNPGQTGSGQTTGSASGTVDHVLASNNKLSGICACPFLANVAANVTVVDTVASNSITGDGFAVDQGFLQLAHSTAVLNHIGVHVLSGTVVSFGDNHINENDTNVFGTVLSVGTR
jgi:hypothetical protein